MFLHELHNSIKPLVGEKKGLSSNSLSEGLVSLTGNKGQCLMYLLNQWQISEEAFV